MLKISNVNYERKTRTLWIDKSYDEWTGHYVHREEALTIPLFSEEEVEDSTTYHHSHVKFQGVKCKASSTKKCQRCNGNGCAPNHRLSGLNKCEKPSCENLLCYLCHRFNCSEHDEPLPIID